LVYKTSPLGCNRRLRRLIWPKQAKRLKRDHSIATVEDDYRKLYFDQGFACR
jgi:hypothetical protein